MTISHAENRSSSNRRTFLKAAGSLATIASVAGCSGDDGSGGQTTESAADYPSKNVTLIIPYATGGGFDAYARLMKPYLEDALGTTVTVQNVTGGAGVVGATQAYHAEPDGYTMLIWDVFDGTMPQIGRDVRYDLQEMTHVGYVTQSPNALTIMKSAGIDGWETFASSASRLNFATQGRGSISHMGVVLLGGITDEFSHDDLNFIHYGGTGPALGGLEKGEADEFMVGTSTSAVKVVQALDADLFSVFAGDDHPIADYMNANDIDVTNWMANRDVKNVDEYGELTVFRRFLTGPPGVPKEIQHKQVEAFKQVLNNEEFQKEAREAARPLIKPKASPGRVSDSLQRSFDTFGSKPYKGIIQKSLSG